MTVANRLDKIAQWGFFVLAMSAAGARSEPGERGVRIEMLCACFVLIGFLAWALARYIYAWVLAIQDIKAKIRAKRAPATEISSAAVEVLAGRCPCQMIPGQTGRCTRWECPCR